MTGESLQTSYSTSASDTTWRFRNRWSWQSLHSGPDTPNPDPGGLPEAFTFYGDGASRNGISPIGSITRTGFRPRIGVAWLPGAEHKTVLRGSFAITRPLENDNLESDIGSAQYTTGFSGVAMLDRPQDYVGSPAYY